MSDSASWMSANAILTSSTVFLEIRSSRACMIYVLTWCFAVTGLFPHLWSSRERLPCCKKAWMLSADDLSASSGGACNTIYMTALASVLQAVCRDHHSPRRNICMSTPRGRSPSESSEVKDEPGHTTRPRSIPRQTRRSISCLDVM